MQKGMIKEAIMRIKRICRRMIELALDIAAPTAPAIREIEADDGRAFSARVGAALSKAGDAFFLFPYKKTSVKAALVELKTYKNTRVADVLGEALFDALDHSDMFRHAPDFGLEARHILVMPVPITPKKKRERGWNQCDLILDGFARAAAGARFEARKDILAKIRETEDQVGKSRGERVENLRDSFAVRPAHAKAIQGRAVIVIDDILTTGSTLGEAKRALLSAGAHSVICLALAH